MQGLLRTLQLLSLLSLAACADPFTAAKPPDDAGGTTACSKEGELQCQGAYLKICEGAVWQIKATCAVPEVCSASLGRCAACDPGLSFCAGDEVHSCNADGTKGPLVITCPAGKCQQGACADACGKAAASRSYVGCHYWPTVTLNSVLPDGFTFAVVVANAQSEVALITVESASNPKVATAAIAPGSVGTIVLPWVDSLQKAKTSVLDPAGAYHLVSTVPVTVYQFNPLDYKVGANYSYTNDASLLLPEHALQREYMVIAYPTGLNRQKTLFGPGPWETAPAFFSVVATKEGTTKVDVTFTAPTLAGTGGLAAYSAGQSASFTLSRWGVLQIASAAPASGTPTTSDARFEYVDLSATHDLTGTVIRSDQDVAVFSGNDCTYVPYNKLACDHLEEQLFPTKSWGKRYLLSHTDSSGKDPNIYRVVSAEDGNQITFTPASVHAPVTLGAGKSLEVTTSEDFEVSGSGRLAVAQFMVGQTYSDENSTAPGDPSMALAVPTEQYRTEYRFLAPASYAQNFVNITAPTAAVVTLDGQPVAESEFKPLGAGMKVAKVKIQGGSHLASSPNPFGIAVYGVGDYTSYMVPGGLDLKILLD